MRSLLACVNPGSSVFAGEAILSEEQLERVARYIARPVIAIDGLRRRRDGQVEIPTPGATMCIFDPLDWIHTVPAHIPDRGRHQIRYYGALSNRGRFRAGSGQSKRRQESPRDQDDDTFNAGNARVYALIGRGQEERRLIRGLRGDPILVANVHAALGDRNEAFRILEEAIEERNSFLVTI